MNQQHPRDQHSIRYRSVALASDISQPGSATSLNDDEIRARIYTAWQADPTTRHYIGQIEVNPMGDTVVLRGTVASLEDWQSLVAITQYAEGVTEVADHIQIGTPGE